MGVYIFRSRHAPWIKVGHHRVTPSRPNVYYRVAGRGFYSCVHPRELRGRLALRDLELVAWYPALGRRDERQLHRAAPQGAVGEFHRLHDLEALLRRADALGARATVGEEERAAAIAWAGRRGA